MRAGPHRVSNLLLIAEAHKRRPHQKQYSG